MTLASEGNWKVGKDLVTIESTTSSSEKSDDDFSKFFKCNTEYYVNQIPQSYRHVKQIYKLVRLRKNSKNK